MSAIRFEDLAPPALVGGLIPLGAEPRRTPDALVRSRRLLSGAFGNTGFEASTSFSVTILLRAIGPLTRVPPRWYEGPSYRTTLGLVRHLNIQQAARAAGVAPSAIRWWERRGLLDPERTARGHRRYAEEDLSRIRHIWRLRAVQGLNLAAIAATLSADGDRRDERQPSRPNRELGRRLQALRKRRGFTLRESSRRTGLARSFISAIEQGAERPSVASLQKLARSYRTTISELTAPRNQVGGKVIRAGKYRALAMLGDGIRIEQLAEGRCVMDCHRYTLNPGAASQGQYAHEGEEFIHVLSGQFEITLDGREHYRLGREDSMYFKSTSFHSWINPGPDVAVLIWINTPPTF